MACPRNACRVLATWIAALTFSGHATGQSATSGPGERVRVELSVPDGCAERERFFAQVRDRLGTGWEAAPGELARTIHVNVSLGAGRYVAHIELTDARGRRVARAVAGIECQQVIDSIALITVLAIQAQVDELISRSEPSDAPGPAATSPDSGTQAPVTQAETESAGKPQARAASESTLQLRLGARAGIQQGIGPELAPIFGGFIGLAWPRLALGVALDAGGTGEVRAQYVPAEFELLAVRVEACTRIKPTSEALTLEPCVFFQAGSLTAQGIRELPRVSQGSRGSTAWLAPGLLLAMRGELGPVFLGLEASAGISLDRESFYVEIEGARRDPVYQVPPITTSAALGAGVAF